MQNFNTNQTRHFYVAGAINSNVDTKLDIALGTTATGEMYFKYRNADNILTRSDSFDPKKIVSLKKTLSSEMAIPLKAHTVAVDTNAVTLANLVGKTLNLIITINQAFDYDDDNCIRVVASVVGNATNTANATAFHKALAEAIALVLPSADPAYPLIKVFSNGSEVTKAIAKAGGATGAAAGVVLVQGLQKFVPGKLTGEPCPFSVAFHLKDSNTGDIVWGTDTVANSAISDNTVVPANYALANLEYFALGERGDYVRGYNYPNEYEPTYAINLSTTYDVLSIEYYWSGSAENVVKSPRLIQIAAPHNDTAASDICTQLFNAIKAKTEDGAIAGLDARVTALEA